MAIADQLTQLSQVKADIKQALIDKGVDMADVPFTQYAEKIAGIVIPAGIEGYQRFRGNYAKDFFARYKDLPGWETNLPDAYFNMGQNVNFGNGSSIADPAQYPWFINFPKKLCVLECYTYCNNWAGITEMAFVYEDGTIEACTGPKSYARYSGGGQQNRTQLKECVGIRLHFYGQGVGYAPDAHYQGGGVIDWLEKVGA